MIDNDYADRPLPHEPTEHWPGTPGKLREMRLRHERGEALFHPGDARLDSATHVRIPILFTDKNTSVFSTRSSWSVTTEAACRRQNRAAEFVSMSGFRLGQMVAPKASAAASFVAGKLKRIIKYGGVVRALVMTDCGRAVVVPLDALRHAGDLLDRLQ